MNLYKDTRFDQEVVMFDIVDQFAVEGWIFLNFLHLFFLYNLCTRGKPTVGSGDEIPINVSPVVLFHFLPILKRRAWR